MLLTLVIGYLLGTIAIGLWAAKRVRTAADFAIAGRHLPMMMIVTTTFATWFGSETVLGIPAKFIESGLGGVVEELVKQNNALDIYEEYFAGIDGQHSSEPPSARTLTVLKDPTTSSSGVQRPVTCVNWMHDGGSSVVLSYSILAFQQQPAGAGAVTTDRRNEHRAVRAS